MIEYAMKLTQTEVLLKIDDVLSNHDRIFNVSLNPFQALDALVACVPSVKQLTMRQRKSLPRTLYYY